MSLILGMTASAASAHKHEFSPTYDADMNQEQQPFQHPLLYLQGRLQAFANTCAAVVSPLTPTLGQNVQQEEETAETSVRTSFETSSPVPEPLAPVTPPASQDVPGTSSKPATAKTTYLLSHPAPRSMASRFRHRNRMLLQLRRIGERKSPTPSLEVFPGSVLPRSMNKRFSSSLKNCHGINSSDLVILNRESNGFGNGNESIREVFSEEEQLEFNHKDVVGSIHYGNMEAGEADVEICLGSSHWTVSSFERGRYEFKGTDDEGNELLARWWVKHSSKRSRRSSNLSTAAESGADRKFNFSILRPDSRRHPIIGRIDQTSIDVFDHYTMPDSPTASPIASPVTSPIAEAFTPLSLGDANHLSYFNNVYPSPNTVITTSADLRKLVLVTGIWVAIAESWCPAFAFSLDERSSTTASNSNPPSLRNRNGSTRTWSVNGNDSRAETPQSINGIRSRVPSWPSRHSIAVSTPDSPARRTMLPRSNSINVATGTIRRRTIGLFGHDYNAPGSADNIVPEEDPSSSALASSIALEHPRGIGHDSVEQLPGYIASGSTNGESSKGIKGLMPKRSKSKVDKGGKREKIMGMIHRKGKEGSK